MAISFDERAAAQNPPPDYRRINFSDGFLGHNGPVYAKEGENGVVFGCRILPHLCNPMGVAHGGWVATMFDIVLPLSARYTEQFRDRFLLTINMSIDYLAGPRLGDWVEGRAEILRITKRMVFIQGKLEVDGELTGRGSGIFRIGPDAPPIEMEQHRAG